MFKTFIQTFTIFTKLYKHVTNKCLVYTRYKTLLFCVNCTKYTNGTKTVRTQLYNTNLSKTLQTFYTTLYHSRTRNKIQNLTHKLINKHKTLQHINKLYKVTKLNKTIHNLHTVSQNCFKFDNSTQLYPSTNIYHVFKHVQHITNIATLSLHMITTLYRSSRIVHNSAQLFTIVHNCSQLCTIVHSCTQLYTTLHNCTQVHTTWHNFFT